MAVIRTDEEPIAIGDEVLIAVIDDRHRFIICIAHAAIDHLAGKAANTDETRFQLVEDHWIRILSIANDKIFPGIRHLRIGLADVERPTKLG